MAAVPGLLGIVLSEMARRYDAARRRPADDDGGGDTTSWATRRPGWETRRRAGRRGWRAATRERLIGKGVGQSVTVESTLGQPGPAVPVPPGLPKKVSSYIST